MYRRTSFCLLATFALGEAVQAQTPYQSTVLSDNPVSYWSFEETSGTTIADNQGLNPGTLIGPPILAQPGSPGGGNSIRFANGGYVTIPNDPSIMFTNTFTLEMWINPTSTLGAQYILDKHIDRYSVILGYQGANTNFYKGGYVGGVTTAMLPVSVGNWYHIVYVKDPNGQADNWRGYLNGVEFFRTTANFTLNPGSDALNPLNLGSSRGLYNYRGYLDEVAVYDYGLSGEQIAAHYCAATGLLCPPNGPPTADAGDDLAIRAGDIVFLDGGASFDDNTAAEALDYSWSFASVPAGSIAMLVAADTATPWFLAEMEGTYVVELDVTDEGSLASTDQVEISSENLAPTAAAGDDQLVIIGTAVVLNGSGSSDPETDLLTFGWTITSAPAGSTATISDPDLETAGVTPDQEGVYVFTLTVSDFIGPGAPDSVEITVFSAEGFAEDRIMCAADIVSGLGPNQVTTKGNRNAFLNFLRQAVTAILEGDTATAIEKLNKSIARSDGCEENSVPDGNGPGRDWITDCNAQAPILACLREALEALTP